MPTYQISFNQQLNPSVQTSDMAWAAHQAVGGVITTPFLLGEIVDVQSNVLVVQDTSGVSPNTLIGMFLLFSKPIQVNESGLKGYYADVTFKNPSKERAELFAVSSEAVISSK
tara:strand:+ start:1307 stop:1645 length:339 start_codon:yes stop_codon:yes gene_type:complete